MAADPSTPFRIVINYRRDDTAGHAGRLYDALATRFGHDHVFMDIDAIEPGVDFTEVLDRAVESCDAFISLIGREWLTITDPQGKRRLDNPGDFVRLEIEAALGRDIRVIPVLVQEAEMPAPSALPDSLAPLAYRNAFEVRDTRWRSDVEQLIRALEKIEREKAELSSDDAKKPGPPLISRVPRRTLLAALGAAGVLGLGVLLAVVLLGDGDEDFTPTTTSDTTADTRTESEPVTTSQEPEPDAGRIVYGNAGGVFTIDADGRDRREVAPTGSAPDWSPDGKKIAFARRGEIWVMDFDGRRESRLTRGYRDNAPAWSADGRLIAFDREAGRDSWDVWVTDARPGGALRNLTGTPGESGAAPDWSPDGERIVYQRGGGLWVMSASGTGRRQVAARLRGRKLGPAWSPDGKLIAFALYPGAADEASYLYVVPANGGMPRRLTRTGLIRVNAPAWSTDGDQLVFTSKEGLWLVGRDGRGLATVVSGSRVESPSWAAG